MSAANCTQCGERLRVESSRRCGAAQQLQYTSCPACRAKGRRIVSLEAIWRRKR